MLRRIAIHLSSDKACERRINAGIELARIHGAEVVGVYPTNDLVGHYYDASIIPQEARMTMLQQEEQRRESTRSLFMDRAQAAGVNATWRLPRGEADESLALHARHCDLLIMSKAEHGTRGPVIIPNLAESVMMSAGRPVLMLPNAGAIESIGQRILFCWDRRRESTRAFSDAAPLLRSCKELVVLEIDQNRSQFDERNILDTDFTDYCTALGYPAPVHLVKSSDGVGVGNVILNTASDSGSDLIIMGAYGHSRMRQWVMGGASRTVLASMTVPVLLAH